MLDKYTGRRLDGRHEIHELIGAGGMALVYRTYDQIDDRTVATKILKDEFLGNEDLIRRFKNESKAIVVLSHPNIVKVYDASSGDQIQYIVMEYVDGITLQEYLDQQKEIKWKKMTHFTVQILRALQHVHEKDIIHRNIKPQSTMLLQDGTVKVTNFSVARLSRNETRAMTDKAAGSVRYVASEQARKGLTNEKTDIYSADIMLYEIIMGQPPFEADSVVSVMIMQLQADPRPSKDTNPTIPDGLKETTPKAMQKDPSQWHQSAAGMLRGIGQFRRNPNVSFRYKYFIDEEPTKYVDAINTARGMETTNYSDSYAYEKGYPRGKKKKKSTVTLVIGGASTAFLLAAVVSDIMALTRSCNTQKIEDVDLLNSAGQKLSDTQADEKHKEFQFKIEYTEDSSRDPGIVLDQNPKGTKKVKTNAEITLTVNGESRTVAIPPAKGLTQAETEKKLKVLSLQYEIYQVEDNQTAAGYIKDVIPTEGSEVTQSGTVVKLYISKGPFSIEVNTPSVIGKNLDATKTDILTVGLTVDVETTYVNDSGKAEGVVIKTSPLPGVKAAKSTPAKISVSSGKKSEGAIDICVQLPSQVMHGIVLRAYLDDTLYSEKTVNPSYNSVYQMSLKGASGRRTLIIQLDGQKYNTSLLDFDTGTPCQAESYTCQEPEDSLTSGIMRAP